MPDVNVRISELQGRRRKRKVYFVLAYLFIFIYLLFLGTSWLVLKSPFFRLKKIEIIGNERVSNDEILTLLRAKIVNREPPKALLGFNNILIWPERLAAGDLMFLPGLKSLEIEKNYRERSAVVKVVERIPYGIWCLQVQTNEDRAQTAAVATSDGCWWFDDGGVILKRAAVVSGGLITAVSDYSQNSLGLNSKILPKEFVSSLFSIFKVLQGSGLNIKEIKLNDLSLQELEILTYDGPKLYFSLRFPADKDVEVIQNFMAKPGFSKLQYLDFRVENRVYYK